ncbi:MAG: phosphatidylethanolamine-binding protein [Candidatus Levybacteria bacterium RBG_16_35_11]|nr:MAG: phosphatidylethanolamine-binding protein [Candidatus Levybacteria bacterium RBG_16_35_11]
MEIKSPIFENNKEIPSKYTCDGEGINPPLTFSNIPKEAKSLVLIMDDPDAPMGTFTHWVIFNIDPKITEIKENSIPSGSTLGLNNGGGVKYVGPCPPSGTHRYFFKLYALDITLSLTGEKISNREVEAAIQNHIVKKAELLGLYTRK